MNLSLDAAQQIKARHEQKLLELEAVTGVDVGPGPSIRIYVSDMAAAAALPTEIEGMTVEVVERRFEPH